MNKYAYIRVSTKDQNIDRQKFAMKEIGLGTRQMFIDKQSGKDFNRKGYKKLVKKLKKGDELYIKSIDRLGRDYDEIIEQWRYLVKKKEVEIIVLDFTGKFIADLVLQVLSYVAQIERENTKQRQAEGIKAAKEKGVRFGRPQLPYPENFEEIYLCYKEKQISKRECARRLSTNHTTFSNWLNRYELKKNRKIEVFVK